MTNTPIPLEARRAILNCSRRLQEMIEDISFQIAMDTIGDSDISPSENDNDEENEEILATYANRIRGQIISRIHLAYMMENTSC